MPTLYSPNLSAPQVATDTLNTPTSQAAWYRYAVYAIIVAGISLRIFHLFYNRSLFIDELYLNINIVKYGFWQLVTAPFEYQQKAPVGYLWSVKLLTLLFGNKEYSLRLFSLVCGIGTLLGFWPLARHFLTPWGTLLAMGILSFGWPFVYHSVEAKQYSTELFASVLALLLYLRYRNQTTWPALLAWGLAGAMLLWFSFSVIFVLVGIAGALILDALLQQRWRRMATYLIPFSLWALSFAVSYLLFVGKFQQGWLIDFFKREDDAFFPVPPHSFTELTWIIRKFYGLLYHPLGLILALEADVDYHGLKHVVRMGWLPTVLGLVGAGALFWHRRLRFAVLAFPLLLALLASAFTLYPFHQRFTVFLAPAFIVFICYGAEHLYRRYLPHRPFMVCLTLLLLGTSAASSARFVAQPGAFTNEYYRDAIFFTNRNFRQGDVVYVYWNMRHAYAYYQAAYGLNFRAIEASNVKNTSADASSYIRNLQPDFDKFKGKKRLWFIYDVNNRNPIGDYIGQPAWYHAPGYVPGQALNAALAQFGTRTLRYQKSTHVVELYQLDKRR